jgi:TonB-dependent SusC/RagA subfamily outer membrane receptor
MLGSSEPLYIIDGAKVQSGAGGLLFLDPEDISRIEVLKDIGSTSIYGSEGANGVILITTKTRKGSH